VIASEGVIVFVIGVDSHKSSLAICVADELGRSLAARTVANSPKGHAAAYAWICEVAGSERVFGIEGTGGFAYAFSVLLDRQGERVFDVPPNQTDRERGRQTTRSKSDEKDALAIARITLRERERLTPLAHDPRARDLRMLCTYRSQLRQARTRTANRLHADLVQLEPGYEARVPALDIPKQLTACSRLLAKHAGVQSELARLRLADLRRIDRELRTLEKRLRALVPATGTTLTEIHGVGTIVAAEIIGEVRSIERFATSSRFARHNGTAPIPASSGRSTKHRLNRGNNRRLNHAIHVIALTQARNDPKAQAFLAERRAEGKTSREAMRSLKRRLSDVVYRCLLADAHRQNSDVSLT
jgi:transposase